ncbi:hypothetical protein BDW22DRAFT_1360708, partial [Trametopsis cervina]
MQKSDFDSIQSAPHHSIYAEIRQARRRLPRDTHSVLPDFDLCRDRVQRHKNKAKYITEHLQNSLSKSATGDTSAQLAITPRFMAANQWQAYVPDWPRGVPFVRMGQVSERNQQELLKCIDRGGLEFKIASMGEWADIQARAVRVDPTFGIPASVRRVRSDQGLRRPDVHKRMKLYRPPREPISAAVVDEELEAQIDGIVRKGALAAAPRKISEWMPYELKR